MHKPPSQLFGRIWNPQPIPLAVFGAGPTVDRTEPLLLTSGLLTREVPWRIAITTPSTALSGQTCGNAVDRVLPGGGIDPSRSAAMAGRGVLPGFIASAEGCHVTDADGRAYVDFLGANGPNILGYRHAEVEAAADAVRRDLTTASLFPPSLVEVIERLLAWQIHMAWGVAAKNGSEAVSLAARVARQHRQRRGIVAFERAYHGNDPELASGPPVGTLTEVTNEVHRLPWNGAQELIDYVEAHHADIAAVVMNPLDQNPRLPTISVSHDFVVAIEQVRNRFGVLVVLDDVRHGMRVHPDGSQHELGLEPDLIALGKALGNGHSISAVLGAEDLRPAARKILFTSTYMFEAPPMAAAIATIDIYQRDDVFSHIVSMGQRLCAGIVQAASVHGHSVTMSGPPTMPTMLLADDDDTTRRREILASCCGYRCDLPPIPELEPERSAQPHGHRRSDRSCPRRLRSNPSTPELGHFHHYEG